MDELKSRFPTPLDVLQAAEREIDEAVLAVCVERVSNARSPIPGLRFFSVSEVSNLYSPMDMPPDQRGNLQRVLDRLTDSFRRLEIGGYIKQVFDQPAGALTVTEKGREGLQPRRATTPTRRLAAILVIDTVGFSRLTGLDEEGTLARLKAIRDELTDPTLARCNGRLFKTTGDGLLAEFASVVDAMRCGVAIQTAMEARNVAAPAEHAFQFRIGIHVGDVIAQGDGDVMGDGVNIAARLEPLAVPGGICVSGQVKEYVEGKLDVTFEDIGEQTLKNIVHPVRVFRVHPAGPPGGPRIRSTPPDQLIALGPDVVCSGELTGFSANQWELRLTDFVIGNVGELIALAERFEQIPSDQRYILVNALGDGRKLVVAPSFIKTNGGFTAKCEVFPKFPRVSASDLDSDATLSEKGDLILKNGDLATVSGVEALPQRIRTSVSSLRGESPFQPDFGTRLAEYYNNYKTSPWLGALLKLEVIRQASISYHDTIQNREYTPLQCIERVWGMELLAKAPEDRWLPVRFDFEVAGVGRRQFDVSVLIPQMSELSAISARAAANRNLYFPAGNDSPTQVRPITATRSLPSPR
jgi:class 3 adenylate cyclase